nr:MAG TPA: hypothetical protein [Caudoviricetes sp.]
MVPKNFILKHTCIFDILYHIKASVKTTGAFFMQKT